MDSYETTIVNKAYETDKVIFLSLSRPDNFGFEAGQFITLVIDLNGETRYKQYSIYSHPDKGRIRLCVKLIKDGFASTYFENVDVGASLAMMGPVGQFTLHEEAQNHVFLSTGVGVAPMHSMIQEAMKRGEDKVVLYHGVRGPHELIEQNRFKELDSSHASFSYHPVFSRSDAGKKSGYVQDHVSIQAGTAYYLCGVAEFVNETRSKLREESVPEALIKTERFT